MNPFIVYCNRCFRSALIQSPDSQYYFTSCGKVLCHKCLSQLPTCTKCGPNCSKQRITNQMDPQVSVFFKDNFSTLKRILKSMEFQNDRYKKLVKYQYQKISHLENSLQEKCGQVKMLQEQFTSKESIINNLAMKLKETEQYIQKVSSKQNSHHSFNSPSFRGKFNSMNSFGEDLNATHGISSINMSQNQSFQNVHVPANVHIAEKVTIPRKSVNFGRNGNVNQEVFHSTPIVGQSQRQQFKFGALKAKSVVSSYSYKGGHKSSRPDYFNPR